MNESVKIGRIYILLSAILWGLAGVCVKSIPWSAPALISARSLIAMVLLGIYRKSFKLSCNRKTVYGAIALSFTGILYLIAIKMTTAASAIVLQYAAPIFVYLYAVLFQKRNTNFKEICIVLIVFFGCFLSFVGNLDFTKIIGNMLALASGITFAAQIIIFSDKETQSFDATFLSNIISLIICLPLAINDSAIVFTKEILFWVIMLGVFQYGLANIFYAKGCNLIDKVECSLILTIEPIFNPIPVMFINHEMMNTLSFFGFLMVIGGVTAYTLLSNQKLPD